MRLVVHKYWFVENGLGSVASRRALREELTENKIRINSTLTEVFGSSDLSLLICLLPLAINDWRNSDK